ncbi:MAG TPA: hypothetical protein VGE27_02655 [Gemmatimonas sp.]|uniref:hypothetical protein n=1 Tax=Gemmatimonas sp. TaxID=1962908 RepID=UPI002EDAC037
MSPRSAFAELTIGIHVWVPLLLISIYRVSWLAIQYPAGRRMDRVVLNLGVQSFMVGAEYALLLLPLLLLFWLQGARFAVWSLFALVLMAASVSELGSLLAALVGWVFFDFNTDPSTQLLTNLGWMVSVDRQRALHHLLSHLDAFELYATMLVAWGADVVVQGLSPQQIWRTVAVVWVGLVFVTTLLKWYVS